MPKVKQKTHKGTAKVCKSRPGGTIKIGHPGTRHNTGKKNNRTTKQTKIIIFKKVNNFFFKVINALFLIIILNVSSS